MDQKTVTAMSLTLIREWNGEDVNTLRNLLETAKNDPEVTIELYGGLLSEIISRYGSRRVADYLRDGREGGILVAVDTTGRRLLAYPWGEGWKDEDYEVQEIIPPLSLQEHLNRASELLQKQNVPEQYNNLAGALRLIAEVVEEIPITSLDDLEQVLILIRDTHDLLYEQVLYDLENTDTVILD